MTLFPILKLYSKVHYVVTIYTWEEDSGNSIPLIDECTIQPVSRLYEDVAIKKQLTEKDATREALEAVQPEDSEASHKDHESDTDIDEICVT